MTTLEIFDPPMCCSPGICGPDIDQRLPMAQEPAAFVANPQVKRLLDPWGESCLPLILREGTVAARGRYPTRRELAHLAGLSLEDGS